ncbi:hypothetical protein [Gordonia sp. ABSL49_1]|uniref:hypothetical protein n=1 Tax=Gordonia sp. ABSL49_1 TaxID=2920941 RepID=UPI001F0D01C3|nr:hypothetical protein [Gordonia sp. ABSL49_1]MCH5642588.1 hypothetical protein [Gordonia sp. ABSL49_1]
MADHRSRRRTLRATALAAALTIGVTTVGIATTPAAAAPAGCVPFGTAQLPPGPASTGGRTGLAAFPTYRGTHAPVRIDLRSNHTQFNRYWEFALVDAQLLTRPRSATSGWRVVPLPGCLRGNIVAISVDDDELVGIGRSGWIYTMDNVTNAPVLWNWTSAWGSPLWLGSGRTLPDGRVGGWALSVTSPTNNRVYADIAGRVHPSGSAKMTMIPALTGDGSRITYADPWLPNDDSYEIGSPLGGRFRSVALSAAASTTFVMNRYGDMYTRTFDFDSSGSDSVFFRYSWEPQTGKPSAATLTQEYVDRSTAAVQLPAPGWTRQPKITGEITSAITVFSLGPGVENRELRVEGRRNGRNGYWRKHIHSTSWVFVETDAPLLGRPIANSAGDRSAFTLAPPKPWNLTASLPSRRTLVDGQLLIDIGLPYSVVDPRSLDQLGMHAAPSEYRLAVTHFDPAVTTRDAVVIAPGGRRIPVLLHTADGMRMTPSLPGLTSTPRHLVGAIEIPKQAFAHRAGDPALRRFVATWMRGKPIAPITLSATTHDLVVR